MKSIVSNTVLRNLLNDKISNATSEQKEFGLFELSMSQGESNVIIHGTRLDCHVLKDSEIKISFMQLIMLRNVLSIIQEQPVTICFDSENNFLKLELVV